MLTPRLPASHSVPHLSRPVVASCTATPGPAEPVGLGLFGGSSQHLWSPGRAVGARKNDPVCRKTPGAPGMAVENQSMGTQLTSTVDDMLEEGEPGSAASETFPRLEPPPTVPRKRIPRALKTPQDMLISSQPVLSNLDGDPKLTPGWPPDPPLAPTDRANTDPEAPNGEVPDLLYQDSQDATTTKPASPHSSPQARSPCLDPDAPHPDLLAFE
ncbi:uncharacterized protein C1orf226 homolog [Suncus etruscus]|uniref:uncharacterized protein C1orf226 homolog n=1 Tax=Suncus etruscus TaxID=109475 RepID=UPI0021109982|nr:uncharacterized protein C1orf226 homolog [Suncus etruscus]